MPEMVKNIVRFALAFAILGVSQSGIIEQLRKCSIKDSECHKQLYQELLYKLGESGIPELNMPPYDPYNFKNITVEIFNLLKLTFIDGVVKGVKDCKFEEFTTDFEKGIGKSKVLCDIVIKGNYKLFGSSPAIGSILGGSNVHGEGKAKAKIEKLKIELDYPIIIKRHDDGEIYLDCKTEEIQKKFDVLGKVTFAVNKIFVGKEDVSEMVNNLLNKNYKDVFDTFGHFFYAKAGEIMFDIIRKFFDNVPAKHYFYEDLTSYLTK